MARYSCPICGDPRAYIMWLDDEPPSQCPNEPDLKPGRGFCAFQLRDAERAALWRKVAPDCFDARGNTRTRRVANATFEITMLYHSSRSTVGTC